VGSEILTLLLLVTVVVGFIVSVGLLSATLLLRDIRDGIRASVPRDVEILELQKQLLDVAKETHDVLVDNDPTNAVSELGLEPASRRQQVFRNRKVG